MLESVPTTTGLLFILTVAATAWLLFRAVNYNKTFMLTTILYIIIQSIVSYSLFYTDTMSLPPKFALLVMPSVVAMIIMFNTEQGRMFIDKIDRKWITYMNVVRLPVEIGLYLLFIAGTVPELMTYEGRNLDIITGITAPVIGYLVYSRKSLGRTAIVLWNIMGLCLLINIVGHAILSAPTPFQKLAFEQPNIAVMYFPFSLLPGFIVPAALFSHLVGLRREPSNQLN